MKIGDHLPALKITTFRGGVFLPADLQADDYVELDSLLRETACQLNTILASSGVKLELEVPREAGSAWITGRVLQRLDPDALPRRLPEGIIPNDVAAHVCFGTPSHVIEAVTK